MINDCIATKKKYSAKIFAVYLVFLFFFFWWGEGGNNDLRYRIFPYTECSSALLSSHRSVH